MGYYIRVLGTRPGSVPLGELRKKCDPAVLDLIEGEDEDWDEVVLRHPSGAEIAIIEKDLVNETGLGADEVQEFMEEISPCKPESSVVWLKDYLPKVKVIYAFQLLSGTDLEEAGHTCTTCRPQFGTKPAASSKRMARDLATKKGTQSCGNLAKTWKARGRSAFSRQKLAGCISKWSSGATRIGRRSFAARYQSAPSLSRSRKSVPGAPSLPTELINSVTAS